jgi:hypothetical protein
MLAANAEKMPAVEESSATFIHIGRGVHPRFVRFADCKSVEIKYVCVSGNDEHGGAVLHATISDHRLRPVSMELHMTDTQRREIITALERFNGAPAG